MSLSDDTHDEAEPKDLNEYFEDGYYPIQIGDLYSDRYQVIRKLGTGYFSTVWLSWDLSEERFVALKLVKSSYCYSESVLREIEILKAIKDSDPTDYNGNRVVQWLDDFMINRINGSHICIVLEALGPDIMKFISKTYYHGVPLKIVKCIIRQVLEGLDYIHTKCNVIHTDIKPENILLCASESHIQKLASDAMKIRLARSKWPLSLIQTVQKNFQTPEPNAEVCERKQGELERTQKLQSELEKEITLTEEQKKLELENNSGGGSEIHQEMNETKVKQRSYHEDGTQDQLSTSKDMIESTPHPPDHEHSDLNTDQSLRDPELKVKIADFGNACWLDNGFSHVIYTQNYSSLGAIFGAGYNTSSDVWSTACMAFEMATGNYQFYPHSGYYYCADEHLAQIIIHLGQIPNKIAQSGGISSKFLHKQEKHISLLEHKNLIEVLTGDYKWSPSDAGEFAAFLQPMLDLNPNHRATAAECLQHPWLKY